MNAALAVLFPLLMLFAAFSDLFTMKISNRLVGVTALAFLGVALFAGLELPALGMHIFAGLAVLAVTFGLFAAGWIGGGDAKLAAAIGMWMGFEQLFPFLAYASVIGGVLTLVLLMARRFALPKQLLQTGWILKLHNPTTGIPYGIALAVGALLLYTQTEIYHQLVLVGMEQQVLLDELQNF